MMFKSLGEEEEAARVLNHLGFLYGIQARHDEAAHEVLGQQERLWSTDEEACVLVGPMDTEAMDRVTAYMRGYES